MTRLKTLTLSAAAVAIAIASFAATHARAQSDNWNALYDRIIRIEHEIKSMRGAGGGAAGGDQGYRLAAIEDQLRRLIGSVDQMRGQMQDMQNRIKRLEQRKSSKKTSTNQVAQADTLPAYDPNASTSTFEFYNDESNDENSDLDLTVLPESIETELSGITGGMQSETAAQPQVLGQLIIKNDGGLPDDGQSESTLLPGRVESAALDNPTPSTGGGGDLYEQSYKNLLARRFGLAEAGFKTFINKNPKHPSASKAHYWLGETYYVQGRFKQAAQSFLTGYRTYPKGARAPESLLKLGMSLNKLGQKKQACGAYAEVGRSYPSAKSARKQASREIKRAGC